MTKINSLQDVVIYNLCVGCGICEAIYGRESVEMKIDKAGFYRPVIKKTVPQIWEEIRTICPGIILDQENNITTGSLEMLWGPIASARVGYSTDEQIRFQASSGGAISAILVFLLEKEMVDYVLHVGPDKSDPFITKIHLSRTRQEVLENAGSRYAPTTPLVNIIDIINKENVKFAFVGKPCDVAALQAYAKINPTVKDKMVLTVSFFCAGVPSQLATYAVVRSLGLSKEEVAQFRYRGFGWPGKATAIDLEGKAHTMSYDDSWGKILGRQIQFRCKICPDGVGEFADIACGDAWFLCNSRPSFDEQPGRSVILARTGKGQNYLEKAEEAGYLKTEDFDLNELGLMQPFQKLRRGSILPRLLALKILFRPIPKYRGFYLLKNSLRVGIFFSLRQFLGTVWRLLRIK